MVCKIVYLKYYMYMKKIAFTLVELIVVVTILAILATVGFVTYSSYLLGTRDANRISTLKNISNGFELYKSSNKLPIPDDSIEIKSDGNIIGWQWYLWNNVLESIGYNKGWVDPLDETFYSYLLTSNKKQYQFMAFLEKKAILEVDELESNVISKTHAEKIDYYDRYPKIYGKRLWIMTDIENTPLQEIEYIYDQGYLDIFTATGIYVAYFDDNNKIKWDHNKLSALSPYASCTRLRDYFWKTESGFYKINPGLVPDGEYSVYCDMEHGWGWWTLIATSAEDNEHFWTFNNRAVLYDKSVKWNVDFYKKDYKSLAYGQIKFKDMMFLDRQWVWGAYDDIQPNREKTVDEFIPTTPVCAFQGTGKPYYMTSGSVSKAKGQDNEQQDRTLFFTVRDHEGWCTTGIDSNDQHAYGPTWGYRQNNGQSPDDPGIMGWGPSETSRSTPTGWQRWHLPGKECRDARVGRKDGDHAADVCAGLDGDYILWFVR